MEVTSLEGPQPMSGRPNSPFRPGQTREMTDTLISDPQERRRRGQAAIDAAIELNPFLADTIDMPPLPANTEEWTYMWKRYSVGGATDDRNIYAATSGRLRWQFLTAQDLGPKDRKKLEGLASVEGRHAGRIVFKDLMAARAPTYLVRQMQEAQQIKSRELIMRTKGEYAQAGRRVGIRTALEENDEKFVDMGEGEE